MGYYIKDFFETPVKNYTYNAPKAEIINNINEILKKKNSILSEQDFTFKFLGGSSFRMTTTSPAMTHGLIFSSTLYAQIIKVDDQKTVIQTTTKPGFGVFVLFFVTLIFGIVYLFRAASESSTDFLGWGLGMAILGPCISIGIRNIGRASIYDRYNRFIHSFLMKSAITNVSQKK